MTHPFPCSVDTPEDCCGRKIAARLSAGAEHLPHDTAERLRVARVRAVARRRKEAVALRAAVAGAAPDGTLPLGLGDKDGLGLWGRIASALPLMALAAGLVAINIVQSNNRANELAEVDAALLTDDLPPAAYVDPGFAQFLQAGKEPVACP